MWMRVRRLCAEKETPTHLILSSALCQSHFSLSLNVTLPSTRAHSAILFPGNITATSAPASSPPPEQLSEGHMPETSPACLLHCDPSTRA